MPDISSVISTTGQALGGLTLMNALYALVTLLICLIARKVLLTLFKKALGRTKLDGRLTELVIKVLGIVMWFVIILTVCGQLGINITSLVALFSVVGLAFSLAVQDSLSNLAGGITIISTRPFKVGDYVEAGGQAGTVSNIGIIYTQIITIDGKTVHLPNSTVASGVILNYSTQPVRRMDLNVTASYDDDTEKVKAALLDAAANEPRVLKDPAPLSAIAGYGESSITYLLRVWVNNADYLPTQAALTESFRAAFQKHGVSMTYNHVNVHMVKD